MNAAPTRPTQCHRRFYELADLGWERPVIARLCPSCQRRLPRTRGLLSLEMQQ